MHWHMHVQYCLSRQVNGRAATVPYSYACMQVVQVFNPDLQLCCAYLSPWDEGWLAVAGAHSVRGYRLDLKSAAPAAPKYTNMLMLVRSQVGSLMFRRSLVQTHMSSLVKPALLLQQAMPACTNSNAGLRWWQLSQLCSFAVALPMPIMGHDDTGLLLLQ